MNYTEKKIVDTVADVFAKEWKDPIEELEALQKSIHEIADGPKDKEYEKWVENITMCLDDLDADFRKLTGIYNKVGSTTDESFLAAMLDLTAHAEVFALYANSIYEELESRVSDDD